MDNCYSQHIFVHTQFHSTASSYFARDSLFFNTCRGDSWLTRDNFPLICLYCHNMCLQQTQVLFCTRVVCQQLRGSHKCSKLFILHVFLVCAISFQITKPGNVCCQKKYFFCVYPRPPKYLYTKNRTKILQQTFPDYSVLWIPTAP